MNKRVGEMNANTVGVAPQGDPYFEESTQKSSKPHLSLISNFQPVTSYHRGITLIALIITIIVMLILVGVTVNVAINEGLFKTAKEATTQTQKSIDAEQLQTVALGTIDMNTGKIDLEKVQKELSNWEINKDNRQCTSPNGNKFIIYDDGSIEEVIWEQLEDGSITNGEITLQIGDYVNYEETVKANPVIIDENSKVMKDLAEYSGYKGTSYNTEYPITQENLKWRILDVKNGRIRLISEYPTKFTVYLYSYNGYNNAVYLIDEVCRTLYTTDKGKAQNLKIEDIEDKIDKSKFDYTQYASSNETAGKYGEAKEYETNRKYPEIFLKEKNGWVYNKKEGVDVLKGEEIYDISEQKELIKQTGVKEAGSKIKVTQTYWNRVAQETDWINKTYQNIFIRDIKNTSSSYETYWLSSRCVNALTENTALFKVHYVHNKGNGFIGGGDFYYSTGWECDALNHCLRPVVSINPDVEINKEKVNNVWQIK